MSDDKTHFAYNPFISFKGEGEEEYRQIESADISVDTPDYDTEVRSPLEEPDEGDWEGEVSITFEAEEHVRCPSCGLLNPVPARGLLRLVSKGPLPCRLCGHSLL